MTEMFLYLIKANLALALFYLGYYLLLRKLTFYGINRYYLIFALVFSALYPLIPIENWFVPSQATPTELLLSLSDWRQLQLPEKTNNLSNGFTAAYRFSVGLFGLLFLIKLLGIGRIHFRSIPARWDRFDYRKSEDNISPFSFWTNIYFNPLLYTEDEYEKIFSHEQVHVRQLHSLDILLAEILLIFFWYNPFCWLIRKAIQENIEFITDQRVLSSGIDKKSYQYSLIQISTLSHPSYLGNHFNFKNLKKRISMMNKKQSSNMQLGKYVFIIPAIVLGSLIFGVSQAFEPEDIQEKLQQSTKINNQEPAIPTEEKEEFENQSSLKVDHKAVIVAEDTLPSGDQPLLMIDGSLYPYSSLNKVDPEKIQSIDVIKNAAALNIYGAKAQNGIIKVSTKKGNAEAVRMLELQDTLNTNGPLYVIDGKKQRTLGNTNSESIKAINVLKDKSGIDAYGEEGRHGVIEVTTKKGTKGPVVEKVISPANKISVKISTDSIQLTGNLENHREDKEPVVVRIQNDKATSLKGADDNVLIFVDGKKSTKNELSRLDPESIEAMNVFKGKNAIELYGDEGKDGVVEITTKNKN